MIHDDAYKYSLHPYYQLVTISILRVRSYPDHCICDLHPCEMDIGGRPPSEERSVWELWDDHALAAYETFSHGKAKAEVDGQEDVDPLERDEPITKPNKTNKLLKLAGALPD